jgi:hypothetical protein
MIGATICDSLHQDTHVSPGQVAHRAATPVRKHVNVENPLILARAPLELPRVLREIFSGQRIHGVLPLPFGRTTFTGRIATVIDCAEGAAGALTRSFRPTDGYSPSSNRRCFP